MLDNFDRGQVAEDDGALHDRPAAAWRLRLRSTHCEDKGVKCC